MAVKLEDLIKKYKKAKDADKGLLLEDFFTIIDPSIKAWSDVSLDDPEMDQEDFNKAKKTQELLKRALKDKTLQQMFIDSGYGLDEITGKDIDMPPLEGIDDPKIIKQVEKRTAEIEKEQASDRARRLTEAYNKKIRESQKLLQEDFDKLNFNLITKSKRRKSPLDFIDPSRLLKSKIKSAGLPSTLEEQITPTTLAGMYKKFRTSAQSLSEAERNVLRNSIYEALLTEQIDEKEADAIRIELDKLSPYEPSSKNYKLSFLKTKQEDQRYANRFDLQNTKQKLFDAIKDREVNRLRSKYRRERGTKGYSEDEVQQDAREIAYNFVAPYRFYATSEFKDKSKPSFQSAIRNIETGTIYDPETKEYRPGTTLELLTESLKKQRLDTDYEADLKRAQLVLNQYKKDIKEIGQPRSMAFYSHTKRLEDAIKKFGDEEVIEAYKNAINDIGQRDLSVLKEKNPIAYGIIDDINKRLQKDILPKSKVDKAIKVLTTPTILLDKPSEEGGRYETEFARALRVGFGIPPAVLSAAITEMSPGKTIPLLSAYSAITGEPLLQLFDKSKMKRYRVYEKDEKTGSVVLKDKSDITRQAIINLATGQGLGEAFRAIKPLADLVGEETAFGLGIAAELPLPLTGIPSTAKAAIKTIQLGGGVLDATGKVTRLSPLSSTGRAIKASTTPLEFLKSRAIIKEVDDIFKGQGKEAVKRLNSNWDFKKDLRGLFNKEIRRNELSKTASDVLAENISAPIILEKYLKSADFNLKELEAMRGKNAYVDTLLKNVDGIKDVDEKIAAIKQAVSEKVSKINKAAKKSDSVNIAVQKSRSSANIIANKNRIKKSLSSDAFVKEITSLNKDVINESFKIALAAKIENKSITEKTLAKIANDFARIPADKRTQENLAKIIDVNAFDFVPLDLTTNIMATSNAVSNRLYRDILNKTPLNDMVLMGTTTGVVKSNLTDANLSRFADEYQKILGNNTKPTMIDNELFYRVVNKDKLNAAIIEQVDPNIIRGSEWWLNALKSIDEGKVTLDELDVFKKVITDKLAEKHFRGIPLDEYGEQFQRASVPDPLRGGLFSSTLGFKKRSANQVPGYTKSSLVQDAKDVASLIPGMKALNKQLINLQETKIGKRIPVFNKIDFKERYKPTSATPSTLKIAIDDINNIKPKIYDDFIKEVQENTKRYADPVKGVNAAFDDTWKAIEENEINRIQTFVDRNFNGNWKAYVNTVLTGIDKKRDINVAKQIKAKATERQVKVGELSNEDWQDIVLNYEPYLTKRDIWEKLLTTYYKENSIALKQLEETRYIDQVIKIQFNPDRLKFSEETSTRASTNSNTFTPNISTFRTVIDRLKDFDSDAFKGTGKELKIKGKNAYAFPLMAWAMQTRQANKAKQIINNYVDQNPDKVLRLIQDPMVVKLSEKYTAPIENKYIDLLNNTGLEEEVIEGIAEKMAFQHIKSINAISAQDKLDAIKEFKSGVFPTKGQPLYGDPTLRRRLRRVVAKQNDSLRKVLKDELLELGEEIDAETIDRLLIKAEKDFLGANAKIQEDMVTNAFGNMFDNYRDLLRGSGAIIDNVAPTSLSQYRPDLLKLKDKNVALVYGREFQEVIDKLEDELQYGKFDTYFDDLKREYFESFINDVFDGSRRLTSNGLLGGAWAPNTRNIGMNVASLPFIMMASTGNLGLTTSLNIVSKPLTDPFKIFTGKVANVGKLYDIPADTVAFTDKLGRKYTAGEVKHLMSKYNTGFSRESVVLGTRKTQRMMSDIGIYADGTKANKATNFLNRYAHPAKENIYQRLNMSVDQYVRDQTFITALKGGYTPQQAATLARRSALDYGQINPGIKNALARYTMFVSFRIESLKETANQLYRAAKSDKPNALISILRANQARMREAEAWYYTDDDFKQRFALSLAGKKVRGEDILSGGFKIPALEGASAVVNALSSVAALAVGEGDIGKLGEELTKVALDEQYRPGIDYLLGIVKNTIESDKPGSKIPDAWLKAFRNPIPGFNGTGIDALLEAGLIKPLPVKRRNILSPTYDVTDESIPRGELPGMIQYGYTSKSAQSKVEFLYLAALLAGVSRPIRELSTLQMIKGDQRDDYPPLTIGTKYGKYQAVNPILYTLGLATPKERDAIKNRFNRKKESWNRELLKRIQQESREK